MRKIVIIGCFIAGFLLLIPTSVSAMGYDAVQSGIEKKMETTGPTISVRGGLGVHIDVYGANDETTIFTQASLGGRIIYGHSSPLLFGHFSVYLFVLTIAGFRLSITVNNQVQSYNCDSFYFWVYYIQPIDV
jgi:hypothetical protein